MNSSFISKYKLTIILTLTLAVFLASCISLPTTTPTPGWVVTTLAGNGTAGHHDATGTEAQFNEPRGVAVDPSGILYVADAGNHCIRKITSAGVVTTLAGSGTRGHEGCHRHSGAVWLPHRRGRGFIRHSLCGGYRYNNCIRKIEEYK